MFKKIIFFLFVLVIAVVAAINMHGNSNMHDLSAISLDNVEALAQAELKLSDICDLDQKDHCVTLIPVGGGEEIEIEGKLLKR